MTAMNTAVLELLASRICHDLISPIGAIHNGIEFMQEMGPDAVDDALGLISHSSAQASSKLKLFRLVYGAGGADSSVKPEDVHAAFGAFIEADEKITQDWDPHADLGFGAALPAGYAKILAGTMMMAAECLPKGGQVSVTAGDQDNETLICARGDMVLLRDYYEEALSALLPVSDIDPRLVHPYVLGQLASHYGLRVAPTTQDDTMVCFSLKAAA